MPNAPAINTPSAGFSTYCAMNPTDSGKGLQQMKTEEHWEQIQNLTNGLENQNSQRNITMLNQDFTF